MSCCAYSKLFVSVAVVQICSCANCSRVLAVQYDTPMSHVRTLGIVRSMKSVEDQDVLQDERVYCPISHFHASARPVSCHHFHASYLWRDAATCEPSLQIISKCLDSRLKKVTVR